jgi:hypothetical protein
MLWAVGLGGVVGLFETQTVQKVKNNRRNVIGRIASSVLYVVVLTIFIRVFVYFELEFCVFVESEWRTLVFVEVVSF